MSRPSSELQLLLGCVRSHCDSARVPFKLPEVVDWERILDLTSWHRVSGIVYQALRSSEDRAVPGPILERLEQRYRDATVASRRQQTQLTAVLEALEGAGVATILLKGAALVRTVYEDPALRPMGDLDLLVPETELGAAEQTVRSLGFELFDPHARTRETDRHSPRLSGPDGWCDLELHRHLVPFDSVLAFDVQSLWECALTLPAGPPSESVLAAEDQLLHLCLHFFLDRRLFYQSYSALGQLGDIARVVEHYPGGISWERLVDISRKRGCAGPVACALSSVQRLLAVDLPGDVLEELDAGVTAETLDRFVRHKVLERRPWFFHELVTARDNRAGRLARSAVRRLVFPREYLAEKYSVPGHSVGLWRLLLRHLIDVALMTLRYLRRPGELLEDLRVDRWMHSLELGRDR